MLKISLVFHLLRTLVIIPLILSICPEIPSANAQNIKLNKSVEYCLPKDIRSRDIVSANILNSVPNKPGLPPTTTIKKITVGQKLSSLKAKCRGKQLVDRRGKPIRFYKLSGCWGAFPPNGGEILARQDAELNVLKKRYTVIEMTCNPGGIPYP